MTSLTNMPSNTKGQVLIYLTFFFFILLAIMGRELTIKWTAEIDSLEAQKAEFIAFYLAEAGIEQSKIVVRDNSTYWSYSPSYPSINGSIYTGSFRSDVYYVGPNVRRISSVGTPSSAFTGVAPSKRIEVTIEGVGTPSTSDDRVVSFSWAER